MDSRDIKLIKNNDGKEWTDLEWIEEFYNFLKGDCPNEIQLGKGSKVKLTSEKAFAVIWYLQEHFSIFPDHIEKCSVCDNLYDSYRSGYHAEYNHKYYCDSCAPPFIDEKNDRIMNRRNKTVNL